MHDPNPASKTPSESPAAPEAVGPAHAPAPSPKRRSTARRLVAAAGWPLVLGAAAALAWVYPEQTDWLWRRIRGASETARPEPGRRPIADPAPSPWDGRLALDAHARDGLGLSVVAVVPQTDPVRIELLGTTKYDEDSLTKIRPMFKARVDTVHRTVGQTVRAGDPLIELYSKELAEAKRQYEVERIQWVYDHNLLKTRQGLRETGAISGQLYLETQNNEMKSRRVFEVARDSLLVFGLSEAEIERIEKEAGAEKARMTLRSPADGIVIAREVVPGNLYDENDTLLTIAPVDRLWVWGHVFESDLDLVQIGRDWEIQFPYLDQTVRGRVDYISNAVDPNSHAVRIRTTIPNRDGLFKSDMLVRGRIEVPPRNDWLAIPRGALVVSEGRNYYVFVRTGDANGVWTFERRSVQVAQEKDDHAVIAKGLEAGQTVAVVGALVLNQLFEENELVNARPAHGADPHLD